MIRGAVGDGRADDTAAFEAAIASCKGALDIPAGCFLLRRALVFSGRAVGIRGCGPGVTELRWAADAASRGVYCRQDSCAWPVTVRDLTLSVAGSGMQPAEALTLDYRGQMQNLGPPMGWTSLDRFAPRFLIENVWICGVGGPLAAGWQTGVDIIAGLSGTLRNVVVQGWGPDPDTFGTAVNGIALRGAADGYVYGGHPCELTVDTCTVRFAQNALYVNGVEGVFVRGCNFVGVNVGICCIAGDVPLPQLNVRDTHVNAAQLGIYATRQGQSHFSGNLIYCIQKPTNSFVGLYLVGVADFEILGNTFASTNTTAFDVNHAVLTGCAWGVIDGNVFKDGGNAKTALWLQSGTSHCKVGGSNVFDGTFLYQILDQQ